MSLYEPEKTPDVPLSPIARKQPNSNAFTSLSWVAENQVRINHLTRLQQPMSDPTNEPSREPIREPTKRVDLNALLPNNLSFFAKTPFKKSSFRISNTLSCII